MFQCVQDCWEKYKENGTKETKEEMYEEKLKLFLTTLKEIKERQDEDGKTAFVLLLGYSWSVFSI